MGKKPVLGLVGLCVGLALSGCKDCDCGWGRSSRKEDGTVTARVDRSRGAGKDASGEERRRSLPSRTVAGKGAKSPYDLPADSYKVKAPMTETPSEVAEKPAVRQPLPESDPAGLRGGEIEQVSAPVEKPMTSAPATPEPIAVPPVQPMSTGPLQSKESVTVPGGVETAEVVVPSKLVPDAQKVLEMPEGPAGRPTITPLKPAQPEPAKEEAPNPVPVPAPVEEPEGSPALEAPTAPAPTAPAPEVKTESGPEIPVPSPLPPQ